MNPSKARTFIEQQICECGCLTHSYGCLLKAPTCRRSQTVCERCQALAELDAQSA